MKYNAKYPQKHLSIRVPWHDNVWNGTICSRVKDNSACLVLKNCAQNRNDDQEERLANESIKDLVEDQYPPCVGERATFMAPFTFQKTLSHPYSKNSKSHQRLQPTKVSFPAFSAAAVPYHWMLKENIETKTEQYNLDYDPAREPKLDWAGQGEDAWLQEYNNQKAALNCFFEHLKPESSLVFFYAKKVPFVESSGRVLIGVGKINDIRPSGKYKGSDDEFSAAYWEHMIFHSIRENAENGFLLPYHEALKFQEENTNFNPEDIAVVVPADKQFEFSYAAEHVSSDASIRVLLQALKSIGLAENRGIGNNHAKIKEWIHNEISVLESLRGYYPGMGSALSAFGIPYGHFLAARLINHLNDKNQNPWVLLEKCFAKNDIFSKSIREMIPESSIRVYNSLKKKEDKTRIDFLHLLSRFDLSLEQAEVLFVEEERGKFVKERKDEEYLRNPYLIYEDLRLSQLYIALESLDLGLFHKNYEIDILPDNLILKDPLDERRIRALTIQQLEKASLQGHTLLPRKQIVNQIRELPVSPECPVNSDYFTVAEDVFDKAIGITEMADGAPAYQLDRFVKSREILSKKINDRVVGKRLQLNYDWTKLLEDELNEYTTGTPDAQEMKAREEKAAALKEICESRFSVVIGPAGTGKTTLLSILAGQKEIESNGVLLLAPTGKARVRIEQLSRKINITTKTLAQFLIKYDRYDGKIYQYSFSDKYCEAKYETVILDECSMLTELMLSTTLDCLKGVKRFILVGDHRQLPPIGAGRPFIDIINHLKPENILNEFPRVGKAYAELTIKRRQGGSNREDLQLAEWFSGENLEPAADKVINNLLSGKDSKYLRVEKWKNEQDFENLFAKVLVEELGLKGIDDKEKFNQSLGAHDGRFFKRVEAAKNIENWQILSPIRDKVFGVTMLNRSIHKTFKTEIIDYSRRPFSKLPYPLGNEEIVYGDKIINLANSSRHPKSVYPQDAHSLNYIANGEIGIVTGQWRLKSQKAKPKNVNIEFSSQIAYQYTFRGGEFGEDNNSPLELAYALTVHKAQGSQFKKVFLVVPNPCFLLTREMLYTALTRQEDRVIILFQGDVFDIKELASPLKSDSIQRITNLFKKPELVEIDGKYLEKNLIHQATDGKLLRSKSELMIYQRLLDNNIPVLYERKLTIKEVEKLPDFTIENDDTGETYYWEHCGMMHDEEYVKRWNEKYIWYKENNIISYEEGGGANGTLIITEDIPHTLQDGSVRGALSIRQIDEIIKEVF